MRILSFSTPVILKSLLNKQKKQTIRPSWKEIGFKINNKYQIRPKKPFLKVGEKVRVYWKLRSRFKSFCNNCGERTFYAKGIGEYCPNPNCKNQDWGIMGKIIGEAKITEITEAEMGIKEDKVYIKCPYDVELVAKRDGFKNSQEMFKWFSNRYDLSIPKKFWIYRFRWLKQA